MTRFQSHLGLLACAAASAVLLAATFARAQSEDTSNAATWYRRAYARLDSITPEQWDLIGQYNLKGGAPSPEVRAILQRAQPAIADLKRAAGQSYSDFGIDYSKGIYTEVRHLAGMRSLARITTADAAMRIADGDGAGASAEITSLCRMVGDVAGDHVMISSLVSTAVFSLTDGLVESGFEAGAFEEAESALLLNAMQSFDQHDPFGSVDAMVGEQLMTLQTMRSVFVGGDPTALEEVSDLYGFTDEQRSRLGALDAQAIEREMGAYGRVMDQYIAAFAMDDAQVATTEIARLDAQCAAGDLGIFAQVLAPSLSGCYSSLDKGRTMLAERKAALEKIVGGEVDAGDLANAALWYRRGIERLDALDDAWPHAMAQVDPTQPLSSEAIKALDEGNETAAAAIQQFVDGSKIRHCDFSKKRDQEGRESFVPRYAPGMRDGFRLLALESQCCEAAGDHAQATRLLAAAFRMDAHMAGDRLLVSSLVARDGFLLTARVGQAMEARPFNPDGIQRLHEFLLPETMELAQIDMRSFIELIDQQREPAFKIPETSHIVGVTALMATARQDLCGTPLRGSGPARRRWETR